MLEKVKDIPPKILIVNGNQKQWLQNHPDFGAFSIKKNKIEKMEKIFYVKFTTTFQS